MLNPPTLDHFRGQPEVVARLRVALEAAFNDGTGLPHMLFTGPPGLGKTSLAHIIANEVAVTLHERIGQVLSNMSAVNGLLLQAAEKDIVFIDEAHEMPNSCQTLLYRAIEDQAIFIETTKGDTMKVPVQRFTLVMATTDEYALLPPLRDRCKLILPFSFYSPEALAHIAIQRANMLNIRLDHGVAVEIGKRSRGTPRLAIRLLEACHRYARSLGDDGIERHHFDKTVMLEQIDAKGLGRTERIYLLYLAARLGETVRLHTLESVLGIHRRTIQTVIEPFLVREGFIERMASGRCITPAGIEHLGLTEERNTLDAIELKAAEGNTAPTGTTDVIASPTEVNPTDTLVTEEPSTNTPATDASMTDETAVNMTVTDGNVMDVNPTDVSTIDVETTKPGGTEDARTE